MPMRSALVIRHAPYEGLAAFQLPMERSGFDISYADAGTPGFDGIDLLAPDRSEEHTSELQSLMRISYAVFCLKKKKKQQTKEITKMTYNLINRCSQHIHIRQYEKPLQ